MGHFLLGTGNKQGQVAGDWVLIDWMRPLTDRFDVELEDPEQLDEIETTGPRDFPIQSGRGDRPGPRSAHR